MRKQSWSLFPLVWLVSVLTTIAAYTLVAEHARALFRTSFPLHFPSGLGGHRLAAGISAFLRGRLGGASFSRLLPCWSRPRLIWVFAPCHRTPRRPGAKLVIWNGMPVVLAQFAILAPIPVSADVFVLAITGVYLFRIATLLRYHADDFAQVPSGCRAHRAIWRFMPRSCLLAMMVATDGLIVAASLFARDALYSDVPDRRFRCLYGVSSSLSRLRARRSWCMRREAAPRHRAGSSQAIATGR